ncbi:hypothetical protein G9A89_016827 [Geosiphon pyriformis]|nr:hypothetical protein G9A89_016827 [Geosiphon pyriformis]
MITNRAKSKKVANITFLIVTNKVSTREGLSVIKAARQNILATFSLKNISDKLPLAASDSFFSPVKVPSKRHIWVSPSIVSTTSKSPKIFNNRPVNKLVFFALITPTTISTTTASQMAVKAKNSKKQQQVVTTAIVTPNLFVVLDEIFSKIFTAAASLLTDIDGNSSSTSLKMEIESTVPPPVSGTANGSAWKNVNGYQRFSGWVVSNLVPGVTFKIKMALFSSLFQLLPGCIGLKSVSQDAVKLFYIEFVSQKSLNGVTKVAISDKVFLTTFKIAQSSGVASVSFPSLSVALHDIPLSTSFDDIKTALGIFGVVIFVKLKFAGLWQYAVVNFKNISSTAAALFNWSVLVKKNSIRILLIVNQKKVIFLRNAFKAKLLVAVHVSFFAPLNLIDKLLGVTAATGKLPFLPPKLPFNTFGGPKNFKSSFVGSKSYVKPIAFVVFPGAAAANMDLDLGGPFKTVTSMLPAVSSVPNNAVEYPAVGSKLDSLEKQISDLAALVKSIVEPIGSLVALVEKDLLSIKYASNNFANLLVGVSKNIACLRSEVDFDGMDYDNMQAAKPSLLNKNTVEHIIALWQMSGAKMLPDTTEQINDTFVQNDTPNEADKSIDANTSAMQSIHEDLLEEKPEQTSSTVLVNGLNHSHNETSKSDSLSKVDHNQGEDDSETESETELMSGIAPSAPINGSQTRDLEAERKKHLEAILQKEDGESENDDEPMTDIDQDQDSEHDLTIPQEGLCVECRDQESSFYCEQCTEDFCEMCFAMLHRTGNRRKHTNKNTRSDTLKVPSKKATKTSNSAHSSTTDLSVAEEMTESELEVEFPKTTIISSGSSKTFGDWLQARCEFIPIRLNLEERKSLRLLEAALSVSEYTDKIDIISYTSKSRRIFHQIKDLCAILSGLLVASDYKKGQELFANKEFKENEEFFQIIFEVGRRHKIMNPEKMRDVYGKLMYMLMDSVIEDVQEMLSFSLIAPIKTVYNFLKDHNGLELLHHELVVTATKEIIADGKTRIQVQREIKEKERAIEMLSRKFSHDDLSSDQIKQCLYSIGDNHAYLRANRDCCDRMLQYLTSHFNPLKAEQDYSLAIRSGNHGARLSHTHEIQYFYANQTLSLWREIQNEMFMLWSLADRDLLSDLNSYRLRDTGQGLNRVQSCPNVSKVMHTILHRSQQKAGYWVGSSVIHLGDKNVPNALMFIDKYNQVSRILNPVLICLDGIEPMAQKNEGIQEYIDSTFGGTEKLKKDILVDFFRHAFDGSGADNFFDAGSCIDGRLTSAWNWCSLIEKKSYFPVFLLTGFVGFDGGDF